MNVDCLVGCLLSFCFEFHPFSLLFVFWYDASCGVRCLGKALNLSQNSLFPKPSREILLVSQLLFPNGIGDGCIWCVFLLSSTFLLQGVPFVCDGHLWMAIRIEHLLSERTLKWASDAVSRRQCLWTTSALMVPSAINWLGVMGSRCCEQMTPNTTPEERRNP